MKKMILATILLMVTLNLQARKLHVFESPNLHCNDSVLVFSPVNQENVKNLPTAFVLHGAGGCYSNWSKYMDLQKLADRTGFRIITPDGFSRSWYVNDADLQRMQWLTFFEQELYPTMDREYGLDPEKTFITGLSMGGHGAMTLFLQHSRWFRAGGSMSGVLDVRGRDSIGKILGGEDGSNPKLAEHSAVLLLDSIKGTGKFCIVTCGTEDSLIGQARVFEEVCHTYGVPCISMYSPGKHNWKYWPFILEYHIDWFSRIVNGEPLGF